MSIEHLPDFDESPVWRWPVETSTGSFRAEPRPAPTLALPPRWTEQAACTDHLDLFDLIYETGNPGVELSEELAQARAICAACPVREECLELAMEREQGPYGQWRYGMFGGLKPAQRKALAAERAS